MAISDAFHDGSDSNGIGASDQVLADGTSSGRVTAATVKNAFECSAAGVVQAALYELHRGDRRTFADVLADATRARFGRGPAAADEGAAMNNEDAPGTPPIGTLGGKPAGPIRCYLELGGSWDSALNLQLPWCGSFAAFVYARCGIDVKKGFMSAFRVPRQLSMMPQSVVYMRRDTGDPSTGQPFSTSASTYSASYTLSTVQPTRDTSQQPQSVSLSFSSLDLPSADTLDIRPGDVAWLMHDRTHGHVMVVAAVRRNDHSVDLVTIEGNANNRVQHNVRSISLIGGRISGPVIGWGRPGAIAAAAPPDAASDQAAADSIANDTGGPTRDV
jgi:hypothetical protein